MCFKWLYLEQEFHSIISLLLLHYLSLVLLPTYCSKDVTEWMRKVICIPWEESQKVLFQEKKKWFLCNDRQSVSIILLPIMKYDQLNFQVLCWGRAHTLKNKGVTVIVQRCSFPRKTILNKKDYRLSVSFHHDPF